MSIQLQIGKKYTVRGPTTWFTWAEVVAWDGAKHHPFKVRYSNGNHGHHTSEGYLYDYYSESDMDLVAEYVEPPVPTPDLALELGPEHVGRRVRLRNGYITLVVGFVPGAPYPVVIAGGRGYTREGSGYGPEYGECSSDIVDLLP